MIKNKILTTPVSAGRAFEKTTGKEKIGLSSGNMALSMSNMILCTFLIYFYTDIAHVKLTTVGTVMLLSRVFDGTSDLLIGSLIQRTKSRFGKVRPWYLWNSVPYAVSIFILFLLPENAGDTAQGIFIFLTYNLANIIAYTTLNLVQGSILPLMTRDKMDQTRNNTLMQIFYLGINALASVTTLPLIRMAGGGRTGWLTVMGVYSIVGLLFCLIAFFFIKERVTDLPKDRVQGVTGVAANAEGPSTRLVLKTIFHSRYFYILMALAFSFVIPCCIMGNNSLYYARYVMGSENYFGAVNASFTLSVVAGCFFVPSLVSKIGKKNSIIMGSLINIIFTVPIYLFPTLPVVFACNLIRGMGAAPMNGLLASMVGDVVEYIFQKDHIRTDGIAYSSVSFAQKIGTGLFSAIFAWFLNLSGYVGGAAVQLPSAVAAISNIYTLVYMVFWAFIIIILMCFYDIDKKIK